MTVNNSIQCDSLKVSCFFDTLLNQISFLLLGLTCVSLLVSLECPSEETERMKQEEPDRWRSFRSNQVSNKHKKDVVSSQDSPEGYAAGRKHRHKPAPRDVRPL